VCLPCVFVCVCVLWFRVCVCVLFGCVASCVCVCVWCLRARAVCVWVPVGLVCLGWEAAVFGGGRLLLGGLPLLVSCVCSPGQSHLVLCVWSSAVVADIVASAVSRRSQECMAFSVCIAVLHRRITAVKRDCICPQGVLCLHWLIVATVVLRRSNVNAST
jgi:hypothetical protein